MRAFCQEYDLGSGIRLDSDEQRLASLVGLSVGVYFSFCKQFLLLISFFSKHHHHQ